MRVEWRMRGRRESALAIAEQNGEIGGFCVGNHQIGIAIAIEIADGNVVGISSAGDGRLGAEVTLSVTEEHGQRATGFIGHDDVEVAIMIHISDRDGAGTLAHRDDALVEIGQIERQTHPSARDEERQNCRDEY